MAGLLSIAGMMMASAVSGSTVATNAPLLSDAQLGQVAIGDIESWRSKADIAKTQQQLGQSGTEMAPSQNNANSGQTTTQAATGANLQAVQGVVQSTVRGLVQGALVGTGAAVGGH